MAALQEYGPGQVLTADSGQVLTKQMVENITKRIVMPYLGTGNKIGLLVLIMIKENLKDLPILEKMFTIYAILLVGNCFMVKTMVDGKMLVKC